MRGLRWSCLVVILATGSGRADELAKTYQVVAPKDDGITATGINVRGDVVGFEWVEEKEHPGVLMQAPIRARGKKITYLPLLAGYTSTFPAAVSDDGLVVGRVSKPVRAVGKFVPLRNRAFVWDTKTGIRALGEPADDNASFACGVSRDGHRVSGYAIGTDRVRACVWDRDGDAWKVTVLPHERKLDSLVVPISGNGRRVAGVVGQIPVLWTFTEGGGWTREVIGPANSFMPRGVNDDGTVVGLVHADQGLIHAVIRTRENGHSKLSTLAEPTGYVKSEALAVNNAGAVVGMVDGPAGSKIGPRAFVFESGRIRLLAEGGPNFAAATAINDLGQVTGVLETEDEVAEK